MAVGQTGNRIVVGHVGEARFGLPPFGNVAEAPDATDDLLTDAARPRIAFQYSAIIEIEYFASFRVGANVGVEMPCHLDERIGCHQLPGHQDRDLAGVQTANRLRRDVPHFEKSGIEALDALAVVHRDDSVSGGVERRAQQGQRLFDARFGLPTLIEFPAQRLIPLLQFGGHDIQRMIDQRAVRIVCDIAGADRFEERQQVFRDFVGRPQVTIDLAEKKAVHRFRFRSGL